MKTQAICSDENQKLIPPLRLILNYQCNGQCSFCHHEGQNTKDVMKPSMVYKCASIANTLSIPSLSLTGGEPTLRSDLSSIIKGIQDIYEGRISLTTNGAYLSELSQQIITPLHTVNLSISSFNNDIYTKYQNVDPFPALNALNHFPALNKNLNVVIVKDNYQEINNIISYCINHSLSLVLMFELRTYSEFDILMQQYVLTEVGKHGQVAFQFGTTPSLVVNINDSCKIIIKHPKLSRLMQRTLCKECAESINCYERVCAVRVYPDGTVSPCLNKVISFSNKSLSDKIKNIYALLNGNKLLEIYYDNPLSIIIISDQ